MLRSYLYIFLCSAISIHSISAQYLGKEYHESVEKVIVGDKKDESGLRFIRIIDPEIIYGNGIIVSPYLGKNDAGQFWFRMKVRIVQPENEFRRFKDSLMMKMNNWDTTFALGKAEEIFNHVRGELTKTIEIYDIKIT